MAKASRLVVCRDFIATELGLSARPVLLAFPAFAETPDEWVVLVARVHGAFGAFIPLGIKIGLDANERLKTQPRDLAVTYYDSDKPPCPCFADDIAIATYASVGQRTLIIASEKALDGALAVVVIRPRKGGPGFKYTIPASDLAKLGPINKNLDPRGRWDSVMKEDGLFSVEPAPYAASIRRSAIIASLLLQPLRRFFNYPLFGGGFRGKAFNSFSSTVRPHDKDIPCRSPFQLLGAKFGDLAFAVNSDWFSHKTNLTSRPTQLTVTFISHQACDVAYWHLVDKPTARGFPVRPSANVDGNIAPVRRYSA